jgi:RNA polymerase sigma factor (sigma-70 family)
MTVDPGTLDRYRLKLRYKVCWHLGSSCPDVDDVVQETLTRFLRALREEKIRNPERAGAFLSGVCNNVIQEYRRSVSRQPLSDSEAGAREPVAASDTDGLEIRDAVTVALAGLSVRDQDILRAFFLEGKSKKEVCHSMALSDGQFRVALFRAKGRFRENYYREVKQRCAGQH